MEYIEREAAIDAIFETFPECRNKAMAASVLSDVPAADVVPVRHGRWINYQMDRWIYAKCSECGTVHDVKSNFCPNCGAKMGKEVDND